MWLLLFIVKETCMQLILLQLKWEISKCTYACDITMFIVGKIFDWQQRLTGYHNTKHRAKAIRFARPYSTDKARSPVTIPPSDTIIVVPLINTLVLLKDTHIERHTSNWREWKANWYDNCTSIHIQCTCFMYICLLLHCQDIVVLPMVWTMDIAGLRERERENDNWNKYRDMKCTFSKRTAEGFIFNCCSSKLSIEKGYCILAYLSRYARGPRIKAWTYSTLLYVLTFPFYVSSLSSVVNKWFCRAYTLCTRGVQEESDKRALPPRPFSTVLSFHKACIIIIVSL